MKEHTLKPTVILVLGIASLFYLLNIGVGFIELLPDNIPGFGNLDEGTAGAMLLYAIRYFYEKNKNNK